MMAENYVLHVQCSCGCVFDATGPSEQYVGKLLSTAYLGHLHKLPGVDVSSMTMPMAEPSSTKPKPGPWELAQAFYYAGYDTSDGSNPPPWDETSDEIKSRWRRVADAAHDILIDGKDPYAFMQRPPR